MVFKSILGASCACLAAVSINTNAAVLNTLNGVDYQWLELTETAGMSRNQVQAQLDAAVLGDALYGYEYASRALVEELFLSYSSWDGLTGFHGATGIAEGINAYFNDFGALHEQASSLTEIVTVDVGPIVINYLKQSLAFYGSGDECGGPTLTCSSLMANYLLDGTPLVAHQGDTSGWDSQVINPLNSSSDFQSIGIGSHLVRISSVPIPSAVWLFGSGLLGLIGLARRKSN